MISFVSYSFITFPWSSLGAICKGLHRCLSQKRITPVDPGCRWPRQRPFWSGQPCYHLLHSVGARSWVTGSIFVCSVAFRDKEGHGLWLNYYSPLAGDVSKTGCVAKWSDCIRQTCSLSQPTSGKHDSITRESFYVVRTQRNQTYNGYQTRRCIFLPVNVMLGNGLSYITITRWIGWWKTHTIALNVKEEK